VKFGNLETVYSSAPLEYEHCTLEILLNGEPIVRIDQEDGPDFIKAELLGSDERLRVRVSLDELIAALLDARKGMPRRST
jgi:hypothetical protein